MGLQNYKRILRNKKSLLILSLIAAATVSLTYLIQDVSLYKKQELRFSSETSMPTKIFYKESDIRFKKYKNRLSANAQETLTRNWKKPSESTNISVQIEQMGPLDEANSSIYISGKVSVLWTQNSISKILSPEAEIHRHTEYADDILENTQLITINEANQVFTKQILLEDSRPCDEEIEQRQLNTTCKTQFKLSGYQFSGNFPLKRKLNKFPFDSFQWIIRFDFPGFPIEYNIEGGPIVFKLPEKPIGPYLAESIDCPIHDDAYSGETATACWNNRVRYLGDYKTKDGTIKTNDNISSWSTSAMIYGEMRRAVGTGFFRYLFPVIIVSLVLIVTDLLSIVQDKDLKDVKLVAPPTVILALVFMQSEYHASLPQITYLTYLDKIYYLVYAYSIMSLMTSILEYKTSNIYPKKLRQSRLLLIKNLRIAMGIALLALPFALIY